MARMEIRWSSPKTGYITEYVDAQTPDGAFEMIRARIPDARVSWYKIHHAPPPANQPDPWRPNDGRR